MNLENGTSHTNLPPQKDFVSRLEKGEWIALLLYFPLHIVLLPILFGYLIQKEIIDTIWANVLLYGVGAVYIIVCCWKFLRRDFDTLCDRPFQIIAEILGSYAIMFCCNIMFGVVFGSLLPETNPNNDAITEMAMTSYGPTAAMAVYLAPIVEEALFRGGVFGFLRRYNRLAAFGASMLLFSLYHVWSSIFVDPIYLVFVLQYLPVSYLLCRCYENTGSIWSSIFFHMMVNGVSLQAVRMLERVG